LTPEAASEATLVAGWLRQQQKRADTTVIEVDPDQLPVALAAIRADLARRQLAPTPAIPDESTGQDQPPAKIQPTRRTPRRSGLAAS
jgi:hypothetical protein